MLFGTGCNAHRGFIFENFAKAKFSKSKMCTIMLLLYLKMIATFYSVTLDLDEWAGASWVIKTHKLFFCEQLHLFSILVACSG